MTWEEEILWRLDKLIRLGETMILAQALLLGSHWLSRILGVIRKGHVFPVAILLSIAAGTNANAACNTFQLDNQTWPLTRQVAFQPSVTAGFGCDPTWLVEGLQLQWNAPGLNWRYFSNGSMCNWKEVVLSKPAVMGNDPWVLTVSTFFTQVARYECPSVNSSAGRCGTLAMNRVSQHADWSFPASIQVTVPNCGSSCEAPCNLNMTITPQTATAHLGGVTDICNVSVLRTGCTTPGEITLSSPAGVNGVTAVFGVNPIPVGSNTSAVGFVVAANAPIGVHDIQITASMAGTPDVSQMVSLTITVGPDNDNDGIPDINDPDDDNDGVPDTIDPCPTNACGCSECPNQDFDGDGIPNDQDNDDDNDGWPDAQDPNPLDPTTPAQPPPATDADGDGQPDWEDDDWDNDGCLNQYDQEPYNPAVGCTPPGQGPPYGPGGGTPPPQNPYFPGQGDIEDEYSPTEDPSKYQEMWDNLKQKFNMPDSFGSVSQGDWSALFHVAMPDGSYSEFTLGFKPETIVDPDYTSWATPFVTWRERFRDFFRLLCYLHFGTKCWALVHGE